jgi:hypothetical protein
MVTPAPQTPLHRSRRQPGEHDADYRKRLPRGWRICLACTGYGTRHEADPGYGFCRYCKGSGMRRGSDPFKGH